MTHEDMEDFQMTSYVRYPSKKKTKTKHVIDPIVDYQKKIVKSYSVGELPFEPLLDGQESVEFIQARYDAFHKYWSHCKSKIDNIIEKHTLPLLHNILEEIKSPFPLSTIYKNESSIFKKTPTILLLSGTNIDHHMEIFEGLDKLSSNDYYKNIKLIQLDSKICVDVKSTLRIILLSLFKFQENGMKVPELDFDLIDEYCKNFLASEKADLSNTELRIVLLIKNISTFNQQVLYKVVSILQKSCGVVPLKLIFNIPSFSTSFYDSTLLSSTKKIIENTIIRVENNSNILIDDIMGILFSSSLFPMAENAKPNHLPILLGPNLCKSLLQRFNNSSPTIRSFVNCLKYSIMSHFYSNPLTYLINSFNQDMDENILHLNVDESLDVTHLTPDHQKYIRQLPSVQNFLTKLNNDLSEKIPRKELSVLTSYFTTNEAPEKAFSVYLILRFLPFAAQLYKISSYNLWCFLQLLDYLQDSIISNNEVIRRKSIVSCISNEKFLSFSRLYRFDLYCMVLDYNESKGSNYSQVIRNILQALKTVLPFYFVKLYNKIMDFIAKLRLNSSALPSSFLTLEEQLNKIKDKVSEFDENGEYYYNLECPNKNEDNKNSDGLKNIPLSGKIKFEKLQEDFVDTISVIFFQKKYLNQTSIFHKNPSTLNVASNSLMKKFQRISTESEDTASAFEYIKASLELSVDFSSFKDILLNELFIIDNDSMSSSLYPPARKYIENALSTTKNYIPKEQLIDNKDRRSLKSSKREFSNSQDTPLKKKRKSELSTISKMTDSDFESTLIQLRKLNKPFMVEMFKLFREAPLYINIADYFNAFKLKLDKEKYMHLFSRIIRDNGGNSYFSNDEIKYELKQFFDDGIDNNTNKSWEMICMTFFIQSLADLQCMGVLKESTGRKKTEYLEKNFWKTI